MRTCVASFFDSANLGDLLIARSLHDFAAEFGPVERVSYSGDPFNFPDPEALPARSVLPSGSPGLRVRLVSTRIGHTAWRVKESRSTRHSRILGALGRSNLLMLGGGNMIFDLERWSRSSDRFRYFVDTARSVKTPTFGISLGIGPFASARQHKDACRALDRCEWLTFRDRAALELYLEHGRRPAELGVDPVLLMDQTIDRPHSPLNRVAFNLIEPRLLCGIDEPRRQAIMREHAYDLTRLVSDGCEVELFTTDRADEPFLEELETFVGMSGCRIRAITGLTDLLALYREVDLVVASRMHALIVAFTQGTPVVGLSWQAKVHSLFDLIGRSGQCLPFLDRDPQALRDLIDEASTHPQAFAIDDGDRDQLHDLNDANRRVVSSLAHGSGPTTPSHAGA